MTPATEPRAALVERLLLIRAGESAIEDAGLVDLPRLLRSHDLLIVNDAATLPASLAGVAPDGAPLELRLAAGEDRDWTAVVFGSGDWRMRTEDRPLPPLLSVGDVVRLGADLSAEVRRVSRASPRLIDIRFDRGGARLLSALYAHGRPVQYSYLRGPVALWDVQTPFAGRPWAVEPPSAGRAFTWGLVRRLEAAGVALAAITHAAGLSSTGEATLDALLPLPERYEVPESTVAAVAEAREKRGRILAVGTTVVRALETSAARHAGRLTAERGVTDLKISRGFRRRVVDGILTGIHEPASSHFGLLTAFADPGLLLTAFERAERAGYLCHEFGDASLVLAA
jgi:S-adenosylmethionine:tRNA ribosyltransferase-isomerase